ncbi:interferon alpha-inducible protein 27, mitochondrial [Plakobranchus ocellatus]|uniref:Interferon alpha-inducible protein 27, mitochondrial n=1 Tax=Plakobranchus ocellatus TaxID=259542 RepID=A0AAV4BHN4_9GAST|nr:interferon alpha-inducible protein 27, mitochondrial [Plakobranchus ocellatus]
MVASILMQNSFKKAFAILACAVLSGAAVVYVGPLALDALGFTSAGIRAKSFGAIMMSLASKLDFGGEIVAFLQSAGAKGLGSNAFFIGASVGAAFASICFWIKDKLKKD